jgi:hypothetical protein
LRPTRPAALIRSQTSSSVRYSRLRSIAFGTRRGGEFGFLLTTVGILGRVRAFCHRRISGRSDRKLEQGFERQHESEDEEQRFVEAWTVRLAEIGPGAVAGHAQSRNWFGCASC